MKIKNTESLIHQSAALRGVGDYQGAIDLIQTNLESVDPDLWVIVKLEMLLAAESLGNTTLAIKTALEIANEEPELPSIQKYL